MPAVQRASKPTTGRHKALIEVVRKPAQKDGKRKQPYGHPHDVYGSGSIIRDVESMTLFLSGVSFPVDHLNSGRMNATCRRCITSMWKLATDPRRAEVKRHHGSNQE